MNQSSAINFLLERSELTVRRAGLFCYPKRYMLPWRNVPDYDLILIGRGEGDWEIEGHGRCRTAPGSALLLSPKIAHGTAGWIKGPYDLVSIHFDLRLESGGDFFSVVPFKPLVSLRNWAGLYARSLELAAEWEGPSRPGRSLLVHDLARSLIVEMVRHYARHSGGAIATDARVLEVLRRLDEQFAGPLAVADMGQWVGLSPAYMRQLFHDQLGISPVEALQRRRIAEARRMLLGSSLPVKEIAHRCGFGDPLYFSRAFRGMVGISPLEFRQSAKNP